MNMNTILNNLLFIGDEILNNGKVSSIIMINDKGNNFDNYFLIALIQLIHDPLKPEHSSVPHQLILRVLYYR